MDNFYYKPQTDKFKIELNELLDITRHNEEADKIPYEKRYVTPARRPDDYKTLDDVKKQLLAEDMKGFTAYDKKLVVHSGNTGVVLKTPPEGVTVRPEIPLSFCFIQLVLAAGIFAYMYYYGGYKSIFVWLLLLFQIVYIVLFVRKTKQLENNVREVLFS